MAFKCPVNQLLAACGLLGCINIVNDMPELLYVYSWWVFMFFPDWCVCVCVCVFSLSQKGLFYDKHRYKYTVMVTRTATAYWRKPSKQKYTQEHISETLHFLCRDCTYEAYMYRVRFISNLQKQVRFTQIN